MDWQKAVSLAKHYKAIGQTEIPLPGRSGEPLPWEFVSDAIGGGMHRNGVCVSICFKAKHPSGLTFSWFYDLEDSDANGRSGFYVKTDEIRRLLTQLPIKVRAKLASHLKEVADGVRKTANEYATFAANQAAQAMQMESLAAMAAEAVKG